MPSDGLRLCAWSSGLVGGLQMAKEVDLVVIVTSRPLPPPSPEAGA